MSAVTAPARIPVVVVSLVRAAVRRASIERQFGDIGIPFTFVDAVEGKSMSAAEIAALDPRFIGRLNRHEWLPGELGNCASFHRVLRAIADGADDAVCVLEDDAILTPHFPAFIDVANLRTLPRFDVLRLESSWVGRYLPLARLDDVDIVGPYRLGPLACAQIFTRDAARKILPRLLPSLGPLDLTLYMDRRMPDLRILDVLPAVVEHPADSSFIETTTPRVAPPPATIVGRLRARLFRAGCDYRTATSFRRLWGSGAKQRTRQR